MLGINTDFAIMITIANTIGFGAVLTKYTYNKYIYIYYIIAFICVFVKNAHNSSKLMQAILSVLITFQKRPEIQIQSRIPEFDPSIEVHFAPSAYLWQHLLRWT